MKTAYQGDILQVEGVRGDVVVASTNRFNRSGVVVACPLIHDGEPGPLHIEVHGREIHGVVICEQLKSLDLSARGYSKRDEISLEEIMEVSDAIQGIFDYIYGG